MYPRSKKKFLPFVCLRMSLMIILNVANMFFLDVLLSSFIQIKNKKTKYVSAINLFKR